MVSNGNQHHDGGNRHNSGGVRHNSGGVQYISAIDEKKDESKPSTSLHKLTWHTHSNGELVQGMTDTLIQKAVTFCIREQHWLNCLIFFIVEHIFSILMIHSFFYRYNIRN
ncbi:hypothetical protein MTR67_026581 [Solanum verrucosum]|uniref:Uncharacterized protein n=1 Tax=Solanum verrucosum TaxID=315347 RepID=A0AAF0R0T1_SOLVR|nr:hypothetical protein MTR67_026581 [Solanum verrucosum]